MAPGLAPVVPRAGEESSTPIKIDDDFMCLEIDRTVRATARKDHYRVPEVISYCHAYELVCTHGETGLTARLAPFTVDGLTRNTSLRGCLGPRTHSDGPARESAWRSRRMPGRVPYMSPRASPALKRRSSRSPATSTEWRQTVDLPSRISKNFRTWRPAQKLSSHTYRIGIDGPVPALFDYTDPPTRFGGWARDPVQATGSLLM